MASLSVAVSKGREDSKIPNAASSGVMKESLWQAFL